MTKHDVLYLLHTRKILTAEAVASTLRVTGSAARAALHRLLHQWLVQHFADKWVLTDRGRERLTYFDADGCGADACARCQDRKGAGHVGSLQFTR
jgi:predicted ArsR family transcriptional regulator